MYFAGRPAASCHTKKQAHAEGNGDENHQWDEEANCDIPVLRKYCAYGICRLIAGLRTISFGCGEFL